MTIGPEPTMRMDLRSVRLGILKLESISGGAGLRATLGSPSDTIRAMRFPSVGSRSRVFVAAVAFGLAWFRASPISAQTGEPAAFRAYHDRVFFSSNNELWR